VSSHLTIQTPHGTLTLEEIYTMRNITLPLVACFIITGCFEANDALTDEGTGSSTDDPTVGTTNPSTTTSPAGTTGTGTGTATTDETSTTNGSTGTDGSTTENPPSFCGDGQIDEGEECDDGENNGPGQACLDDCQLNVCGDGDLGPGEACDDGPDNKLELGACAPDCSTTIEAKEITFSVGIDDGNLGQNPVATTDGLCDPGYKALFAYAGVRELEPLTDWPLHPYTAYVNAAEEIVWVTDATPALGVREGAQQALENPIHATGSTLRIITGLHTDWATRMTKTCNGWSSASSNVVAARGDHRSETEFLHAPNADRACDELSGEVCQNVGGSIVCTPYFTGVYCVEQ
jgi:hypothetical protein